ncbi:MAG: dTDP-4-dehydrorhamnose reductase [Chthoniobacteraceae bacterium]|nr:dTDP-4-dehydrorhamnose reductase [Chthoniobacteraceae bacterium]
MGIANRESVKQVMEEHRPWALINAAGFARVDEAELNKELCFRENALGPVILAKLCQEYGAIFLTFSSHMVFDGQSNSPYLESSPAAPLNIYGLSKLEAEAKVLEINPTALVIRSSSFFGPWDERNFLFEMIGRLEEGQPFQASKDHVISPTYVPDLVNNCLDLIIDKARGIWHWTNPSQVTWAEFAFMAAETIRLNTALIETVDRNQLGYRAKRPAFSALASENGSLLPRLHDAINRFALERACTQTLIER